MKYEYSCGAVVFTKQNDAVRYVIVRSRGGTYGFPKGHRKKGESERQTALREILEETGLSVRLLPGFICHDQHRIPNKPGLAKRITYFLGSFSNQEIVPQATELMSAELMSYDEAMERFQFGNTRRILEEAHRFLTGKAKARQTEKKMKDDSQNRTGKAAPGTADLPSGRPAVDYGLLLKQAEAFAETDPYVMPFLSNVSALLYESLPDLNWAGFYLLRGGRLVLGPFQGKPACIHIPLNRGVCGTAAAEDRVLRVPDVHAFPGHIACDSASRSEIVVPLRKDGAVFGVLDIDSPFPDRFSAADEEGLAALAGYIGKVAETD